MSRFFTPMLVAACLSWSSADTWGDHGHRALRQDFDRQRAQLANEHRARLEAARFDYHRDLDAIRIARKDALHIDCHETRAARLRAINHHAVELARDFGARNRAISRWYRNEREYLQEAYSLAKRSASCDQPTVFRPVPPAHADDCSCSICQGSTGRLAPVSYLSADEYHPARPPWGKPRDARRDIDWAGLLLQLLLR